jgi:hypothetical protein
LKLIILKNHNKNSWERKEKTLSQEEEASYSAKNLKIAFTCQPNPKIWMLGLE